VRSHLCLTAFLAAAVITGFGPSTASAGVLTLTAQDAASASSSPFPLDNLGSAGTNGFVSASPGGTNLGGATVTFPFDYSQPPAGIYDGSSTNARSPFTGTSLTTTNYLVAQPGNQVNITFASPQIQFNLLWGSVDTFNSLSIELCNRYTCGAAVEVTGSRIAAAVGGGFAADGTTSAFVELSDSSPFNEIILATSGIAFEFVPGSVAAPEPATLGIFATGLVGIGPFRRRRTMAR
jgi:hypothetical protein